MPVAPLPELVVADAPEWRQWLEAHHTTSTGIRLVITRKGGTVTALTMPEAVEEALCFGWIDGQAGKRDDDSYCLRFTPRRPRSIWSKVNVERVERLEADGRMTDAGRAAVDAAKADGRWDRAYAGPATAEPPTEFLSAVSAVPEAQAMYDLLTSGNRFAIAFRLVNLKTEAARQRNITAFVDMLARHETPHPQKARPDSPPRSS